MIAKSTVNGALKAYAFTNLKDAHSINWSPLHLEQEAFLLRLATKVGYVRGCRPRFYFFCFTEDLAWKKIALWRVNKNEKMEQAIDHRLKEMSSRLMDSIAAASHCPDTNCAFYKRCHPFETKENDTQVDEQDETETEG
jgi:beta-mannanase